MTEDHRAFPTSKARRIREFWLIALLSIVVAAFYAWTALPVSRGPFFGSGMRGYYNLQANGFLKGQLALDAKVDPFLLTLKDPWDPVARGSHGLHDASYFKGEYHMYFGVSPVVVLFLPFRLLTGVSIDETMAILIFAWAGFLVATATFWKIRWRYFPAVSSFWFLSGVAALGLATMMPALLRRAAIWEVPITGAYFFATLALLFLYQAIHYPRRIFFWALASLFMGLTIGARPVYLFGAAGLFLPLLYLRQHYMGEAPFWKNREFRRTFLALFVPLVLVGVGLAAYNYGRFGSITEFGQRYQMAGAAQPTLFSWRFPLYGLRVYFLEPAGWSRYFPFVNVITPPPPPPDQLGIEDPYGVLPNIPFAFFCLGLIALPWAVRVREERLVLRSFCASVIAVTLLTIAVVISFGGITNRYMIDFVPEIILLADIGLLAVFSLPRRRGVTRVLAAVATIGICLFSIAFNVLASIKHNDLFRVENPPQYRELAHAFNYLSYTYDRVLGHKFGPLEMKVIFPKPEPGRIEAFVVTGGSFRSDYIYVHYLSENTVRFGFEHTSYGGMVGKPVKIKPGEVQTVRVDLGSLYPPDPHPYYDHLPKSLPRILQRSVLVSVDGQVSLRGDAECYDAISRDPLLGTSGDRPGFKNDFSGKIVSWRRASEMRPVVPPIEFGPAKITLHLPAFSGVRSEPLVSTGETGKGDVIFINYLDDHTISFGHDNWGGGGRTSDPFPIDYGASHDIVVDFGALYSKTDTAHPKNPSNDSLVITVDGKVAMETMAPFHPCEPETVAFGTNAIHASSTQAQFSGDIERVSRVAP
ncbi:MAG TPA: hypothetical protein VFT72_20065 [Opitutaceae bacterium]|nr:hypothetical protein [Opitutaceae bacterium]